MFENQLTTVELDNISNQLDDYLDPSDPKYTFKDWSNFNPSDWFASIQQCYGFGEVTVIIHASIPTLKLFIAKELGTVFEYKQTKNLTDLLDASNSNVRPYRDLKEIKDLEQIFENRGKQMSPQGMRLVNYAGFYETLTKSGKKTAKYIQAYIYGSILPSISETGKFDSNQSTNKALEEIQSKDLEIPDKLQNILNNAFNSFFELYSKQNELIAALHNKNSELVLELTNLSNKLETHYQNVIENSDNIKYLLHITKFNIPNKFFTLEEVCYYLNTYFKRPSDPDMTIASLKRFLVHIKMLKSNFVPYVGFAKAKFIIEKASPFGNSKETSLELSKDGVDYIIEKLQEFDYI